MIARGSPTITVRMPRELIDALKQSAADRGITLSDIVREACNAYIKSEAKA